MPRSRDIDLDETPSYAKKVMDNMLFMTLLTCFGGYLCAKAAYKTIYSKDTDDKR